MSGAFPYWDRFGSSLLFMDKSGELPMFCDGFPLAKKAKKDYNERSARLRRRQPVLASSAQHSPSKIQINDVATPRELERDKKEEKT